ncbi:Mut7-C RNAse domain-containing protein [Marinobacter fonticola]|uniref:Mut7-C RNAse domain-containing protein n=1 Tax=Marinobacter fonticola TaxID=2603215 RepID=UPI0011E68B7E|nr:DUF5615 family PIN-like protein [Marinobacter fonticola]
MTRSHSKWIEGALCPLETPKFLCDEMLRGFGQWLRVAGYDTTLPVSGTQDREVLAAAVEESRWLITRDRELLQHRDAPQHVIFLASDGLEANLHELTRRLDLDWQYAPFSRCKRCNTLLVPGNLPGHDKPPHAWQRVFCHCPQCEQIYWEGSHVRRMREKLLQFSRWRRRTPDAAPAST